MSLECCGCDTFTYAHTHSVSRAFNVRKTTLTPSVAIAAVTMSCTPKYNLQGVTPNCCCMSVKMLAH